MTAYTDSFVSRHVGPNENEIQEMLQVLGVQSLEALACTLLPNGIALKQPLELPPALSEFEMLKELRKIASQNEVWRSFIGMGFHGCITPAVIQRNILENPGWYTQYTPYQAEIAQGRLEALVNFQTMISDLTTLPIANASLLDESTAAAEAMAMCLASSQKTESGPQKDRAFFVSNTCHPQTIAVVQTRAKPLGIKIIVGDHRKFNFSSTPVFGALVQYPATDGCIYDYSSFIDQAHASGTLVVVAADLLSLTLLKPPGEYGADIVVGSTQRLGVPMGYGGPHAAYIACTDSLKRLMPGRIVGLSKDSAGRPAARLALQTREQHIRREKATSNICTAQVLLAVMASMYAVYHGPEGLKKIASRIHSLTSLLAEYLKKLGHTLVYDSFFDTLLVQVNSETTLAEILIRAQRHKINLRNFNSNTLGITLDETTSLQDIIDLVDVFLCGKCPPCSVDRSLKTPERLPLHLKRKSAFLKQPVFNRYHSETELLRYLQNLQSKDLSLTHSMIALGSCTMKLNATSEMLAVTWPEFNLIHPFAPLEQTCGYQILFKQLESWLAEITGFPGISLQPNAGSQGEFAGLLVIQKYHEGRGETHRNVCLIPRSAHGTNPASATLAGMHIEVIECDANGNIDLEDLRKKAQKHKSVLSAAMITYPSTHGVFEETISEFCQVVHENGGLVYMDGANLNAQVGLCRPGDYGPDVCHLNLHKTFCIPHGGGGPGMGPIGVKSFLRPYLPSHPYLAQQSSSTQPASGTSWKNHDSAVGPISEAPWGSASILPISWAYIAMMGASGLLHATQVAILNANYIARRLNEYYPVLYTGKSGLVAHECIIDFRKFKQIAGIEVEDVAKRLIDYGFHAPTVSFPVGGTMMIEPTESESKPELDRFCEAMICIRKEIADIENGKQDRTNNLLKNAPHTAEHLTKDAWAHPYSRSQAAFPTEFTRARKFWPAVGRINNVLGDKNLVCTCGSLEA